MVDMVTDKLKEVAIARAKVASLEARISALQKAELAGLPDRYEFDDAASFAAAVMLAARKVAKWRSRGIDVVPASFERKRRRRAVITDAVRAKVKALAKAGKTHPQIARALGISEPSVHRIASPSFLIKRKGK